MLRKETGLYLISYTLLFLVAGVSVLSLTPRIIRAAHRWGFLDIPSARKIHQNPTPLLGGMAIFAGFLASFLIGIRLSSTAFSFPLIGFLLGATWVFLIGLIDDKRSLGPVAKLGGQLVACGFLFFSGNTNGLITNAPLDVILSFVWVVGLMNALNFLDNMDGLATGITFLASMAFFILFLIQGQVMPAIIAIGLAGSALAFLRFNFHPASIFLGDAGSLLYGYVLATLGLMSTWHQESYLSLFAPILILGYPIFDVSFVVLTRIARGSHIAQAGKDHSTHRIGTLLDNVRGTAWVVYAACFLLAAVGITLSMTRDLALHFSVLILIAFLFLLSGTLLSRVPIQERATD